jgi:predicted metal-binding membrane protein
MVIWTAAGIVAYLGAVAAEAAAAHLAVSALAAARLGGALLIAAGLHQLTPLKNVCRAKCRSPTGFILTSWRDRPIGAVLMGLLHGARCVGCCWLLFLILFPLGIMNIAAMALITLIVFAEKLWPGSALYGTTAAMLAYGALALALPGLAAAEPEIGTPAGPGMRMPAVPSAVPQTMPAGTAAPARP